MIYSYNKTKEMHQFLKFIFGTELYMFWTVPLSIIRSLALHTQQYVCVIQVMKSACKQAVSISYVYMYCCVYSARLLMMDRETVRNI
jgi:hypothetical protein